MTTFDNLKQKFATLRSKTSSGLDQIPYIVLKKVSDKLIMQYCILFNNLINISYFPKAWKKEKNFTIKKPGKDATNADSYRPISLLPNISKIFEMLINVILSSLLEQNTVIPPNQFGFQHRHSTIHAITKLSSDICCNINNKKCVEVMLFRNSLDKVYMDVRKNWRQFHIRTPCGTILKNKKVVKYLGVYFHQNLNFSMHIKNTIKKASQAFYAAKKLFYSKMLEARVKIICYLSLICPTLTYASPIWFNISASNMEKLRLWERKSLRSCTGTYRKPQSNYLHYYSNETLYQNANINRIDNLSSIK